jgi:hypothetical protein
MCSAILTLQAVVLFLTGVVSIGLTDVGATVALSMGLGLALACVLVAALLRKEWAYWLGWAIQVVSIGLGVLVPLMYFLGVVFAALWGAAYFLGAKIDREKAERAVLEEHWRAEHPG